MGKYTSLRDYLAAQPDDLRELTMSFDEIEKLVGRLPRSARISQRWWANTDDARVEAQAWRTAGWSVIQADQAAEQVVFARSNADPSPSKGGPSKAVKESAGIERIAFFSDAVFAIAITILVLSLNLPPRTTQSNLSHRLVALWPSYGAFALTFLLIGLRWLTHHVQFRAIRYYDNTLLGLNLALLLIVAFIPFSSHVLADYPDSRAACALYAGSMAVAGFLSTALWVHACWIGHLVDESLLHVGTRLNLLLRWVSLPILFGVALIFIFTFPSLWPARAVALVTPLVQIAIAVWPQRRWRWRIASRARPVRTRA